MSDTELLTEALETLEDAGCQFWACDGPTLDPVPMVTCNVCDLIARLRDYLGRPIRLDEPEGSTEIREARYAAEMRRATAGPSPDGCTTLIWRAP